MRKEGRKERQMDQSGQKEVKSIIPDIIPTCKSNDIYMSYSLVLS
jgi:hypothetical protein